MPDYFYPDNSVIDVRDVIVAWTVIFYILFFDVLAIYIVIF